MEKLGYRIMIIGAVMLSVLAIGAICISLVMTVRFALTELDPFQIALAAISIAFITVVIGALLTIIGPDLEKLRNKKGK